MKRNPPRACWLIAVAVLFAVQGAHAQTSEVLVSNQSEYAAAVSSLVPGQTIVLADGTWRDFEIVFTGKGTAEKPIALAAQTPGKVVISGRSNLRLAGEYLEVSGLVFADGYTPTNEVISFRTSKSELAHHSRVTNVVIDAFNNPERYETDFWVMMYGSNNRFDHNYLAGKSNSGVTMAVKLDSEASQNNHHRIDHNYFGPRPVLGSNGGETLRIGTSKYSLTDSHTVVENNYFDRCNGELEIISSKSGKNVFRGNVFFESRGTLTLRHGNDNLIENNVFLGNGQDHTGGIRVINKRQTVRNNYMAGLTGYRFGGALVVMNGVPDSPINRYHQVEDSVIENNTIIDSAHVEFAAGSDDERSAVPIRTAFRNNLIVNDKPMASIAIHDDVSGIDFAGNVTAGVRDIPVDRGFEPAKIELRTTAGGLQRPTQKVRAGMDASLTVLERDATGPDWYAKPPQDGRRFGGGKTRVIEPGQDTLTAAVAQAGPGDILELAPGDYRVTQIIEIDHALTVRGREGQRPRLLFERSTLFELADGGSLELAQVTIDGSIAPDAYGNSAVRTSRYSMLKNYALSITDSAVMNLNTNHSFNFLKVSGHTFADSIEIRRTTMRDISGHVIALDREIDDLGIYNGEYITIEEASFADVGGAVATLYRGGTDESTFGPHFTLRNSALTNVGNNKKRNKTGASVYLLGVQVATIEGNRFAESAPIKVVRTVADPITTIDGNDFADTPAPSIRNVGEPEMPAAADAGPASKNEMHPTLLVSADEIAALGDAWQSSPRFSARLRQVRGQLDAYFATRPDVPMPRDAGGGYTHEQHKRNAKAIHDAGMLFQWTGEERYAGYARDLLLDYAAMYPGLGEHPKKKEQSPGRLFWQSLNEAWWLVYAIQGYDAVHDALTPADRATVEDKLFRTMASFLGDESPQTFDKIHNHGTWATAAVGMTGYVLGEQTFVEKALLGLKRDGKAGFLKQLEVLFSPEGYYTEGPYYQRYALMPFVVFAKSVERNEPERKIFEFRDGILGKAIYTTLQLSYAGLFFPINDAIKDKGLDTVEVDYALSIAYGMTSDSSLVSLIDDESSLVLTADGLRLAMAKDRGQETPFEYSTSHFRDGRNGDQGALSVLRSGFAAGHTAVVFKATSQGMGHGHFDRLNWLYFDNGNEVVSDYGAARFLNVVQKYGGHYLPENKTWAKQTVAHNTLVVDETSHFDGRVDQAEANAPDQHFFDAAEGIRIAAAGEPNAYSDVSMNRAIAMIDVAGAPAPLLVDVLRARGDDAHRFDLPLYYQGQMIAASQPLDADTEALAPVGDSNGYQHLWKRGSTAVAANTPFAFTWLLDDRFYTYTVLADADVEAMQTQIGANDPDMNLRNEMGLLLRADQRDSVSFVNVMEAHGEYNGAREFTVDSASQMARLSRVSTDGKDVVDIQMAGGEQLRLALSYNTDTRRRHSVTLPDGTRVQWRGFYRLWRDVAGQ